MIAHTPSLTPVSGSRVLRGVVEGGMCNWGAEMCDIDSLLVQEAESCDEKLAVQLQQLQQLDVNIFMDDCGMFARPFGNCCSMRDTHRSRS